MAHSLAETIYRVPNPAPETLKSNCCPCPVCGGLSYLFVSRGSETSCADRFVDAPKRGWGETIEYFACDSCFHVFTADLNAWTVRDFKERIYNEHYVHYDPAYTGKRAKLVANALKNHLTAPTKILDYGAGTAIVSDLLAPHGFDTMSYDPFSCTSKLKNEWADVVIAIEVVEHSTKPWQTFKDLRGSVRKGGLVVVSTLLAPEALEHDAWWLAPRNGHVCAFSSESLGRVLPGLKSVTPGVHYCGGEEWNEESVEDLCRSIDDAILCER